MDDKIKISDLEYWHYNSHVPHTNKMTDDTIFGSDIGAKETYEFKIGTPVMTDYNYDRYTLSPDENGIMNMDKHPETKKNNLWKYNEDKIFKDIDEYVTGTYNSHYCGNELNYQNIQTIDLMAAKGLATDFCQANILKYGSRYGSKDGRNKRDLLKVIHYAMLLLHFDGHYSRVNNGLNEFK